MGMSNGESAGQGDLAEINVTPMVDVLLSLLIIFMVSQPKPANEQIPLDVPRDAVVQQPSDPNATLLVTVAEDGQARMGQEPLSGEYAQMVEQFRTNEKAQADSKIAVKGEDKTRYGYVIRVMAAAHEAGIRQVGIASERI